MSNNQSYVKEQLYLNERTKDEIESYLQMPGYDNEKLELQTKPPPYMNPLTT